MQMYDLDVIVAHLHQGVLPLLRESLSLVPASISQGDNTTMTLMSPGSARTLALGCELARLAACSKQGAKHVLAEGDIAPTVARAAAIQLDAWFKTGHIVGLSAEIMLQTSLPELVQLNGAASALQALAHMLEAGACSAHALEGGVVLETDGREG